MTEPVIRPAVDADLPALAELYNHYIRQTPITFDIEPFSLEARRLWFDKFAPTGPYRLLVAEVAGRAVGYASSSQFRTKAAYDTSVETSVYLEAASIGQGIGSALYTALFESLRSEDVHRAYAGITLPNPASIKLHERFGFKPIGVFHEVGRKAGRYWDVLWLEKRLE